MATTRALPIAGALIAAALLLPGACPAAGWPAPDVTLSAGSTYFASGAIDGGGASGTLSFDWPVNERFAFGVVAFADDIGSRIGELVDPNDGTPLGLVAEAHRWTYGGAWHARAQLLSPRSPWGLEWRGGWGYSRVEDDERGQTFAAASAVGFSSGLGLFRRIGARQAIGVSTRLQLLAVEHGPTDDRANRYGAAALEWRWLPAREQ